MAKKNNNLLNSLIDPTIYNQGGKTFVDENGLTTQGFENVPEDWVMFVQLYVKPRNRSVIYDTIEEIQSNGQISNSEGILLGEIPFYNKKINKSDVSSVIPYEIQTTEYTELFGAKTLEDANSDQAIVGQSSAFGISTINIRFEDHFRPTVDITFIDVRGSGLSAFKDQNKNEENIGTSPYDWFFLLPWPMFCLKVKGFFGKMISFPLVMTKFNIKYNNTTGNFDIETQFIGYPFSVFNDINVKTLERLCCVKGGYDEILNVYNKLIRCLDPENPDEAIILKELPPPDALCITQYLKAIKENKVTNPLKKYFDSYTQSVQNMMTVYSGVRDKLTEFNTILDRYDELSDEEIIKSFLSAFVDFLFAEDDFRIAVTLPGKEQTHYEPGENPYSNNTIKIEYTTYNMVGLGDDGQQIQVEKGSNLKVPSFLDYQRNEYGESDISRFTLTSSSNYIDSTIQLEQQWLNAVNRLMADTSFESKNNRANPKGYYYNIRYNKVINALISDIDLRSKLLTNTTATLLNPLSNDGINFGTYNNNSSVINIPYQNHINKEVLLNLISVLNDLVSTRIEELNKYGVVLCTWFIDKNDNFESYYPFVATYRPSLQRLMSLLSINIEAFLNLMLRRSKEAEKYHEKHKTDSIYRTYFKDASNKQTENNTKGVLTDVKLYPWPKTYRKNTTGSKIEVFPTELNEAFHSFPEVQFTLDYINSISSKSETDECSQRLEYNYKENPVNWTPLNIFEDGPFTTTKDKADSSKPTYSPYSSPLFANYISYDKTRTVNQDNSTVNDREDDEKLAVKKRRLFEIIASRAFLNVFYFNNLGSENIGGNTDRTLYKYQTQLSNYYGDIEANNLINTLDGCDLINLCNECFKDVDTAVNEVKSFMTKKLFHGQDGFDAFQSVDRKYYDNEIKQEIPMGAVFYLGNNETGTSVIEGRNTYLIPRTVGSNLRKIIEDNFNELTFRDKVGYPFTRLVTIYFNDETIVTGLKYDVEYKDQYLRTELGLTSGQDVILNYSTFNPSTQTLPMTIERSTIPNPNIVRNYVYNLSDVKKIKKYDKILSNSSFRTLDSLNLTNNNILTNLGYPKKTFLYTEFNKNGFSRADNSRLFLNYRTSKDINTYSRHTQGFSLGDDYLPFNLNNYLFITTQESDPGRKNMLQYVNFSDNCTYYSGYDHVIEVFNVNRDYSTFFGNYVSDIFKSFLWDPTKRAISSFGDSNNFIVKQVSTPAYNKAVNTTEINNIFKEEIKFGSWWKVDTDLQNTQDIIPDQTDAYLNKTLDSKNQLNAGFQNLIFYGHNLDLKINNNGNRAPFLIPHYIEGKTGPSLIRYLLVGQPDYTNTPTLPNTSLYLNDFANVSDGFDGVLGLTSSGGTYTIKDLYDGKSPFLKEGVSFLSYSKLRETKPSTKNLALIEVPTDIDSNWLKNQLVGTGLLPVKKYQTSYMKKLSYLIWKEAAMRVLKLFQITFSSEDDNLSEETFYNSNQQVKNSTYFLSNIEQYSTVLTIDDPITRPGGPNNNFFVDSYPQSKFYNNKLNKIGVFETYTYGNMAGYYITSSPIYSGQTPYDNTSNVSIPYPNENPTNSGTKVLLSEPESYYSGPITINKHWSKLYIHQTELWDQLVNNSQLTSGEVKAMKTYLVLSTMWGSNSFSSLHRNIVFTSPINTLYRVNNLDIITLGAYLWTSYNNSKLDNGSTVREFILDNITTTNLGDGIIGNIQDPNNGFPFNVYFEASKSNFIESDKILDRHINYGPIANMSPNTKGYSTMGNEWKLVVDGSEEYTSTMSLHPNDLADDIKQDLINQFIKFAETSEFTREIDNMLDGISMLGEISEIALNQVEDQIISGETSKAVYHKFPFDLEQTLLMWSDWASIVDLNQITKDFQSYYDNSNFPVVRKADQGVVLSTKLFDLLSTTDDNGNILDNPFKTIKTTTTSSGTFYHSPFVRVNSVKGTQRDQLALKGEIGKKILMRLMKVIPKEYNDSSFKPIIQKVDDFYETNLNYHLKSEQSTTTFNDKNFVFNEFFNGLFSINLSGGMVSTDKRDYNLLNLGGYSLYIHKSWLNMRNTEYFPGMIKLFRKINTSAGLDSYLRSFIETVGSRILTDNTNYKFKCQEKTKTEDKILYNVNLKSESLGLYKDFTNVYNRWLAGTVETDHTFNRSGCAIISDNEQSCQTLVNKIFIVDRVNRPVGDKVFGDPNLFFEFWNDTPKQSIATFISRYLAEQRFFHMEYPTFFNFGTFGVDNDETPGEALWGKTLTLDEHLAGPAIVIYAQTYPSTQPNTNGINDFVNDGEMIYENNSSDFTSPESRGIMFKVTVGDENNNIFTNIQIDGSEFKTTYESIQVQTNIANDINNNHPNFIGQNLYNLYAQRSYTCSVECFGNVMIQAGMYFYLDNMPIFEGVYIIKKVVHSIEPHNIKTKFWGVRINNIPYPYAGSNSYTNTFNCPFKEVEFGGVLGNLGYTKEHMLEILDGFMCRFKEIMGFEPLVYTSEYFLNGLGMTKIEIDEFFGKYDVGLYKDEPTSEINRKLETDTVNPPIAEYDVDPNDWIDPLDITQPNISISSRYDWRTIEGEREFHKALDIAAPEGTPIQAVRSGQVETIYPEIDSGGYGNCIIIKHFDDNDSVEYRTLYAHMLNLPPVSVNQTISQGDTIGYVGNTGKSYGNHLHIEFWKPDSNNKVNPQLFIYRNEMPSTTTPTTTPSTTPTTSTSTVSSTVNPHLYTPNSFEMTIRSATIAGIGDGKLTNINFNSKPNGELTFSIFNGTQKDLSDFKIVYNKEKNNFYNESKPKTPNKYDYLLSIANNINGNNLDLSGYLVGAFTYDLSNVNELTKGFIGTLDNGTTCTGMFSYLYCVASIGVDEDNVSTPSEHKIKSFSTNGDYVQGINNNPKLNYGYSHVLTGYPVKDETFSYTFKEIGQLQAENFIKSVSTEANYDVEDKKLINGNNWDGTLKPTVVFMDNITNNKFYGLAPLGYDLNNFNF